MAGKTEIRSAPIGIRVTPSVKAAAEADRRTWASMIELLPPFVNSTPAASKVN
jgi:hypothetical protein